MTHRILGSTCARACALTALLFALPVAQAAPLNLVKTFPDFFVSIDTYSYDSGTSTLTIDGTVSQYTEVDGGFTTSVISSSDFDLTVVLSAGNCPGPSCVTSGSFDIVGQVRDPDTPTTVIYDGLPSSSGETLLSGDLTDFGWAGTSNTTGIIEMTFGNASGVIADGPLTQGATAPYFGGGMILTASATDLADSADNFDNNLLTTTWTGSGFGDVFVPVPAAVWLFGSGLLGLAGLARRRTS